MLAKKLRIVAGMQIAAVNAPAGYKGLLGTLPVNVTITHQLNAQHDCIHWFVADKTALERDRDQVAKALAPGGLLLVFYPKQSSGRQTDLTRDKGWECLEKLDMQWLSLVSFSVEWSAFLLRNRRAKPASKQAQGQSHAFYDAATKTVIVPEELSEAFRLEQEAKRRFDALSYSHRKEYVVWVTSAKRLETKQARIAKTIELLLAGKKNPGDK